VFILVDHPCLVTSGSHLPKLDILDIVGELLRLLQELNDTLSCCGERPHIICAQHILLKVSRQKDVLNLLGLHETKALIVNLFLPGWHAPRLALKVLLLVEFPEYFTAERPH